MSFVFFICAAQFHQRIMCLLPLLHLVWIFFLTSKKFVREKIQTHCLFKIEGEGWHNYHHVFPWDYKTSELGDYSLNLSTGFIDFFAKLGWAYNMKTASKEIIEKRARRTGDGSRKSHDLLQSTDQNSNIHSNDTMSNSTLIWGWLVSLILAAFFLLLFSIIIFPNAGPIDGWKGKGMCHNYQ